MSSLAKSLKALLLERNISVSALSRRSGVPRTNLNQWLKGQHAVDLSQLKKVAEALQVSVWRLAYGEGGDPHEQAAQEVLKEIFSGRLQVTIHAVEKKGK